MNLNRGLGLLLVGGIALAGCGGDRDLSSSQMSSVGPPQGKVTLCHATGSETNPYVEITISASAVPAHAVHQQGRDIIPAPLTGCPGPPPPPPPPECTPCDGCDDCQTRCDECEQKCEACEPGDDACEEKCRNCRTVCQTCVSEHCPNAGECQQKCDSCEQKCEVCSEYDTACHEKCRDCRQKCEECQPCIPECPPPPPPPPPVCGRFTGGGSILDFTSSGGRVTHGFQLRCDASDDRQNLQINWREGNRAFAFHLENLTSASCPDNAALDEENPEAGFDTFVATGEGRLRSGSGPAVSGYTLSLVFTDDGEPGVNDNATFVISGPDGVVLTVSGNLDRGNHQAHPGRCD